MLSRSRILTQLTLALIGVLGFIGQANAQSIVLTTSNPTIGYVAPPISTPGSIYTKEFDPTISVSQNGQAISGYSSSSFQVNINYANSNLVSTQSWLSYRALVATATPGTYALPLIFEPAGLPVGVYNATVSVTIPGVSNTVTIQASLTIAQSTTLTLTPTTLNFTYQPGSLLPNSQVISIQPNGTAFPYTVSATTSASNNPLCGSFLIASTTGGTNSAASSSGTASATSPTPITVSLNPAAVATLPAGVSFTCTGTVSVSGASVNGGAAVNVPVSLTISNSPTVSFSSQSLTFNVAPNTTATQSQAIYLANTGTGLPFTATVNQPAGLPNVLSVSTGAAAASSTASGTTPGVIIVTANTSGLTAGSYSGSITVTTTGAQNATQTIPVTINVSATAQITASPSVVNLAYQTGTTFYPTSQTVTLSSTLPNTLLTYAVAVNGGLYGASNQQLFTVTPTSGSTTSGSNTLTISVNQSVLATLPAGTYNANIQVTSGTQTSPFASLVIPVVLTISPNPQITANPSALTFFYQSFSSAPAAQTLQIGSTGTPLSYNLTLTQPSNSNSAAIINVVPLSGTAAGGSPSAVTVSVNPLTLTDGTYTGFITITSAQAANSPVIVPVTLTVSTSASLFVSPGSLTFSQAAGGTTSAQNITLTSSGAPLQYSIASTVLNTNNGACNGLQLVATPSTGIVTSSGTTVSLALAGNSTIPANTTCTGTLIVTSGVPGSTTTSTQYIGVQVTVNAATTLTPSVQSLTYTGVAVGSTTPQSKTITITTSSATPITITAATATTPVGATFLSVSPTTATASSSSPASFNVSINPSNLQAGNYSGTVTFTAPGAGTLTVPVTFTVATSVAGTITGLSNAAGYQSGVVAPGEIVTLFGANLGPTALTTLTLNSQGLVSTSVGGVSVTFDGVPAPIIYVSANQISVVAPYEIANRATTTVQVNYNGVPSGTQTYTVQPYVPALFTGNSQGFGGAAALNQDNSGNSSSNPAVRGTVIQLFGTGEGQTNPGGVDGKVTVTPFPRPVAPVIVRIGGVVATVQYAGEAPGLVSGVMQINAVIPAGVTPNADGSVSVDVNLGGSVVNGQIVGGTFSQSNVVIYVK